MNQCVTFLILVSLFQVTMAQNMQENNSQEESQIPQVLINAVDNGNAESAYFIGKSFKDGTEAIDADQEKAKHWFARAAEMGHAYSMQEYADILFNEEKYKQAKNWFNKASLQGVGEAFYKLAYYPMYGVDETAFDCNAAYVLLEEAQLRNVKGAFNDAAWMLSTLSEDACRSGEKAWRIYSELEALYGSTDGIPWAYWDTKAAILAEISEFNTAIKVQSWVLQENCEIELPEAPLEMSTAVEKYLAALNKDEMAYCHSFAIRLQTYLNRKPWRENPTEFN